jgi:hypothetical protein
MSISVFPAPRATSSAFAATIPATRTTYEHRQSFVPGVYTVSVSPTSTDARISFLSDTALLSTLTTTSGTVSFNLESTATKVFIMTLAGGTSNAVVSITKTADSLTPDDIGNGTLDTINATGTYNQTGTLAVLVYGGGQQGGSSNNTNNDQPGMAGGRAGFINGGIVVTNGPTTVTVGAKGTASFSTPVEPTNSSFGNLITATSASTAYPNGNGGSGGGGSHGPVNAGNASQPFFSWNGNATTGGGGGGGVGSGGPSAAGGGSGIGTGGTSPVNQNVAPGPGTGKASGGAGGRSGSVATSRLGGDGADGVVYVMRGF